MPTKDKDNPLAENSQVEGRRTHAEQLAAEFGELYDDPITVAWQAREAEASLRRDSSAPPPPKASSPRLSVRDRIAAMGAAAEARELASLLVAVGVPAANSYVDSPEESPRPDVSASPPPSSAPSSPSSPRLSREAWHKAELARLQLARRIERQQAKKLGAQRRDNERAGEDGATSGVWSAGRVDKLLRARAKVRARTMEARAAAVRGTWERLCADPTTAHFAIGIKRLCDLRGWTLADPAAQRVLAILEFLRELSTPYCWNAKHVRAPQVRGSRRNAKPTPGSESFKALTLRKYTPAVRGVSQTFLASVAAGAGHTTRDNRHCSTKTVQRALRMLEPPTPYNPDGVGLVEAVQVPADVAEAFELGDTGHAINRYFLADRGSPKPALMSCWLVVPDEDGSATLLPANEAALALPWSGARPEAPD